MTKPAVKKAVKTPKKITASYLHNSGLYYLQRFATSTANFKRVMMRKVDKSCRAHPEQDRAVCAVLVDALVETFIRAGLLNDETFATASVGSLRRRGQSARAIQSRLGAKGLPGEMIDGALRQLEETDGQDDFAAALRFARRRRFGPFATVTEDDDTRRKALATFGRAGFSFALAQRILRMETDEAKALR